MADLVAEIAKLSEPKAGASHAGFIGGYKK